NFTPGCHMYRVHVFSTHVAFAIHLRRTARFAISAPLFFASLFAGPRASAQVSASLRGLVTDASSTAVAGVSVTVRNSETGVTRTVTTDEAGRFLVVSLPVGEYEVRAAKSGFQDAIRSGIRLVVNQDATVDLVLQVSAVKAEVR